VSAVVFLGPTLKAAAAEALCPARFLPPAAQGDVYRAARSRPRAIGIIDGYFEGLPSIWHKEILWAMEQGVHVLGAASMGALRAAELHTYGMRGIGRIFADFRDGVLEDDDEVAVVHGPAEVDYAPLCEPMINIRATLERAREDGVISAAAQRTISEVAKQLFYPLREWPRVLEQAATTVAAEELGGLRRWLNGGRVDRKREDAVAMLAELRDLIASDRAPMRVAYTVEPTETWKRLTEQGAWPEDDRGATVSAAQVLDELRLQGGAYQDVRRAALFRALGLRESARRRSRIAPAAVAAALLALRKRHGLYSRADLERWCRDQDMDGADLDRLVTEEAYLAELAARPVGADQMLDMLRIKGDYENLRARALAKQTILREAEQSVARLDDVARLPVMLVAWFFEEHLGRPVPDDLDSAAGELGLDDREQLYRLLARERLYSDYTKNS